MTRNQEMTVEATLPGREQAGSASAPPGGLT
jgi:hypothetical protein